MFTSRNRRAIFLHLITQLILLVGFISLFFFYLDFSIVAFGVVVPKLISTIIVAIAGLGVTNIFHRVVLVIRDRLHNWWWVLPFIITLLIALILVNILYSYIQVQLHKVQVNWLAYLAIYVGFIYFGLMQAYPMWEMILFLHSKEEHYYLYRIKQLAQRYNIEWTEDDERDFYIAIILSSNPDYDLDDILDRFVEIWEERKGQDGTKNG